LVYLFMTNWHSGSMLKKLAACVLAVFIPVVGAVEFSTALQWRSIGPWRGGRSIAAAGSSERPNEYYFGATGGGAWKTVDGGASWYPVTDGQIHSSSVGAIAIAASNPDVVYIGMGESQLRNNILVGDGLYRSADAGKTWAAAGLVDSRIIARIRIHPTNPDIVYVAALGDPRQPSQMRGVYKTVDGGKNWQRILFKDSRSGAVDLILDPHNPQTLYAALWQTYRLPWKLWSGGPGSGLFKSTDGGTTWRELSRQGGLPGGELGKIGVAVSPANPNRVYAIVEAAPGAGGLYVSTDAGSTWQLRNTSRALWQRSFYFNRVVADPKKVDSVYVLNFLLEKSTDGGRTFQALTDGVHGDHHDLWIDPENPQRLIQSDDGGANISTNGGRSWTSLDMPTAQIYRLDTTTDFPYHVIGAQQDNSSVAVPSRIDQATDQGRYYDFSRLAAQGLQWYSLPGGESGYVLSDRRDPNVFWSGEFNQHVRYNRFTQQTQDVHPYPLVVMGQAASTMPQRWNWVTPRAQSAVDPKRIYTGSQHLWLTENDGFSWQQLSGDLTRAEKTTLGETGGPFYRDQDGPEVFATITEIAPSRLEADTVWVGTDDGYVQVTQNHGKTWRNVTPRGLSKFARISSIEPSMHAAGRAVIAARRDQNGDLQPWIYLTDDYGHTWRRIDAQIPRHEFIHAVREDPTRAGLLYAATEHGVHVSFDAGQQWRSLRANLPNTRVADLKVEQHDLVIATHGRGFYILDNIAPLRQWSETISSKSIHLFTPQGVYRRLYPAQVDLWLKNAAQQVRVEILDAQSKLIKKLAVPIDLQPGLRRFTWDLHYPGATVFPNMIMESPSPEDGVLAPPGNYQIKVSTAQGTATANFSIQPDPRVTNVSSQDYRAQFTLATRLRDAVSAANEAVMEIRDLKTRADKSQRTALETLEGKLYQIKNTSPKDKLAFPIQLNDRLAGLLAAVQSGEGRPTPAMEALADELCSTLENYLAQLQRLRGVDATPSLR
jgi:photosystem II stability/assembly factor-like uncharacterized protein